MFCNFFYQMIILYSENLQTVFKNSPNSQLKYNIVIYSYIIAPHISLYVAAYFSKKRLFAKKNILNF